MPTYEYVCRECGHHIEVVQRFTDDPLQTCERCQGALRKVFSAAGIIFKGSGYYVTDSRADNGKRKAPANGESGKDGASCKDASSTSTSSDSSPDTSTSSGTTSSDSESKSA